MKITSLKKIAEDERGFVSEYYHERVGDHLIVFSKKGAIRGNHYHQGKSDTKNPEILYLLSGTTTLNWKERNETEIKSMEISGPSRIEIPAYTWHQLIAISDCSFLELNSISEHGADTFFE
jgi:dTDP-4-dehydrorhamnose 3,5-epimerase-like enzyme